MAPMYGCLPDMKVVYNHGGSRFAIDATISLSQMAQLADWNRSPSGISPCSHTMEGSLDFSTNRHDEQNLKAHLTEKKLRRHPDFSFDDGNLAILAGEFYFLVHRGLIVRHSAPLATRIENLEGDGPPSISLEGRSVLRVSETPEDIKQFLIALYDGVSTLPYDRAGFPLVATILTLASKYRVKHLRRDLLQGLRTHWPQTLEAWEEREESAEDPDSGIYAPRNTLPHPIMVINLARMAGAPELLPSAFYDLSRYSPSAAAAGYMCPNPVNTQVALLSPEDLMRLLRGREHASRYLSTFIVNELEGRQPSQNCAYSSREPGRRSCQAAFEAITFELLRKINVAGDDIRASDPLYAIYDLEAMLNRNFVTGGEHPTMYQACENCREEFRVLADAVRGDLWSRLPQWFGLEVPNWAS